MTSPRSPRLRPADLDDSQRQLYDAILAGPRGSSAGSSSLVDADGRLEGPFGVFLLQPSVGHALQTVGATLRYDSRLADRLRELAILVVAARRDAPFERHVHEPIARSLGLGDTQLSAVAQGDHHLLDGDDALVATAVAEMLDAGDLHDTTFEALRERLGEEQVFELTAVVGYYSLLALQLRVFHVETPSQ